MVLVSKTGTCSTFLVTEKDMYLLQRALLRLAEVESDPDLADDCNQLHDEIGEGIYDG